MSSEIPSEPSISQSLGGIYVLVVEDLDDARVLFATLLTIYGAQVTSTASVPEALEAFGRTRFDVLVADITLPGEDGFDLIRHIRGLSASEGGRLPVIAVTAYGEVEDREAFLAAGFDEYLRKPIDGDDLVAAIVRLAGKRS